MNPDKVDEILTFHSAQKEKIDSRLGEFRRIWDIGSDRDLFAELAFCILTPQSRARTCWPAVERLRKGDLLFVGSAEEILGKLSNVRFRERKASYIVSAREQFTKDGRLSIRCVLGGFDSPIALREWLVENVKGLGYKEAGHFLRNIGLGEDLAILDPPHFEEFGFTRRHRRGLRIPHKKEVPGDRKEDDRLLERGGDPHGPPGPPPLVEGDGRDLKAAAKRFGLVADELRGELRKAGWTLKIRPKSGRGEWWPPRRLAKAA